MAQSHDIIDDGLELTSLSPNEWRVTNGQIPLDDARSLVAFVEKVSDGYELMRFGDPIEFGRFATMDAVLAHLRGASAARPVVRATDARVTDLASVRASRLA
jgi:hypothetical protein